MCQQASVSAGYDMAWAMLGLGVLTKFGLQLSLGGCGFT